MPLYLALSLSLSLSLSVEIKIRSSTRKTNDNFLFPFFFFLIFILFFQIENPTKAFIHLKSCAAIQQKWPQADSGYYWITIGSREVQSYCDMTNYGKPQVK